MTLLLHITLLRLHRSANISFQYYLFLLLGLIVGMILYAMSDICVSGYTDEISLSSSCTVFDIGHCRIEEIYLVTSPLKRVILSPSFALCQLRLDGKGGGLMMEGLIMRHITIGRWSEKFSTSGDRMVHDNTEWAM